MSYLIINGGKKLRGSVENQSSKNAAESILCACLMIRGRVTLTNVPEIESVGQILKLLKSIGVKVQREGSNVVHLDASPKLDLANINREACEATRTSLLLLGALSTREKSYTLYRSGGCHLGERTVRPHLYALAKLGVTAACVEGSYVVKNEASLRAAEIVLYESGDTTTENVIMAAALTPGVTTIKLASANYMVQDLCYFLEAAGANIQGIGTTTLVVTGVPELRGTEYPVMPDPIVAMTLISLAITTHSHLIIKNCPLEFLELELCKLEVMGQIYHLKNKRLSENGKFTVADIEIIPSKLTALPDKIYGRPFPGLNIDNLPLFIPILTQAVGRTLVHDWAYENRAVYGLDLQKLGAKVTLLDPHRLWVEGPTTLVPAVATCPPALRPAMNLLICMLAAKGQSILQGEDVIERGYEKSLYAALHKAGASIQLKD